MPRVSVLMAAYNAERFVAEAVESVLAQTFADIELVVVDDGSTDATRAIVEGYSDNRVLLLAHPENRGIAPALNTGLARTTGDLIAIQDADDPSLPERLARQVALFDERPDLVIAGSAYRVIGDDGTPLGVKYEPATDTGIRWRGLFTIPFLHPSMIFRADVARAHGLHYEPTMLYGGMDHALACALLEHGRGVNTLEPLVVRRMHSQQVTKTKIPEMTASSNDVTVAVFAALGVPIEREDAARLREFYYRPPERLSPADLQTAALLLDAFEAFRRQPRVDSREARAIGRGLVDTILARSRGGGLRALRASGVLRRLLELDPLGVATSPARWLRGRVGR